MYAEDVFDQTAMLKKIVIVGAGPAGLTLGLLLARHGIAVQILDAAEKFDDQPRATHLGPPAVRELRRAGVLQTALSLGLVPRKISWRKIDGTCLASLDGAQIPDEYPDKMFCIPLNHLMKLLYEGFINQKKVELKWAHKVVSVSQDKDWATVMVETPQGLITVEAEYVIGCDGATSQIRRALLGNNNFPGSTWDKQVVATNVYYDFEKFGWDDINFVIDPENWCMVAKISRDGLYRVTYGDIPGLSKEAYLRRQPMKFKLMLPGNPEPEKYRITNISPYKVHQRCAEKMRVGRFLLAGDAAHLCNPFGGLGLTGALADVGGLSDCLIGMHKGSTTDKILDIYDFVRREKYHSVIDPASSANFRLLWHKNPDTVRETSDFLRMCLKAEKDDNLAQEIQLASNSISHDFTQDF